MAAWYRDHPVKVVVPVSGGKDSQACLQLARQAHGQQHVIGLFCDTRFEHPLTYQHVSWLSEYYGVRIEIVSAGNVPDKVRQHGRFPGGTARFCTSELKIYPSRKFYRWLATAQGGFEVWYGLRQGESPARAERYRDKLNTETYPPHEFLPGQYPQYLHKLGVSVRLPIVEWSTEEVFTLLNGTENPLYREGFDRVGCFPCLAGGDKSKIRAFEHGCFGAQQYEIVVQLEQETGKSVFRAAVGQRWKDDGGNGCGFCSM